MIKRQDQEPKKGRKKKKEKKAIYFFRNNYFDRKKIYTYIQGAYKKLSSSKPDQVRYCVRKIYKYTIIFSLSF